MSIRSEQLFVLIDEFHFGPVATLVSGPSIVNSEQGSPEHALQLWGSFVHVWVEGNVETSLLHFRPRLDALIGFELFWNFTK
jgi:hypothetical protein